jgi:hypothetical protein
VAAGAAASFWTLSAKPAAATETIGSNPSRYFNGAYSPDTSTAAWVSPQSGGNAGATGNYTYDLTVDLTGLNPATAVITGVFSTDNDGSISLNSGAAVATSAFSGYGGTVPFTFNSGFVAGVNTIHVTVDNGGDPTAFFVQFSTATTNPVPTTPAPRSLWLMAVALMCLGFYFFVFRRRSLIN